MPLKPCDQTATNDPTLKLLFFREYLTHYDRVLYAALRNKLS
jgi:hypothetical protein